MKDSKRYCVGDEMWEKKNVPQPAGDYLTRIVLTPCGLSVFENSTIVHEFTKTHPNRIKSTSSLLYDHRAATLSYFIIVELCRIRRKRVVRSL